jgi:hypothetical protein
MLLILIERGNSGAWLGAAEFSRKRWAMAMRD